MIYFLIFTSGLLGIVTHWLNRYKQGRTTSTFIEYLSAYAGHSIGSIAANITASGGFFATLPPTPSDKELILALIAAFTAGYTIDSSVNKDKPQGLSELPESPTTIKEINTQKELIDSTMDKINDKIN